MKTPQRRCTAIKALPALLCLLALALAGAVQAQVVGTVTNLSGPLLVRKADGAIKVLAEDSAVNQGDTLVSEKNTYARIKFADSGEVTLKPNTQFRIEAYSYDAARPENDNVVLNLIKGGLRSITGLLGRRSKEKVALNTPMATIGIRGTDFVAEYLPPEEPDGSPAATPTALLPHLQFALADGPRTDALQDYLPHGTREPLRLAQLTPAPGAKAPGLYVQVLDGIINLSNKGGSQNFSAGQFGYTASFIKPPVIVPNNPGLQFTPPPAFSTSSNSQGNAGSSGKSGNVDCEVR